MIGRILVPLDGSELAERALLPAEALARAMRARLLLLRVAQASSFPGTDPTDAQVEAVHEAEEYLGDVANMLRERGVEVETAAPYGEPADWIVEQAHDREADLIVMATHGRGGLGRLLYGSVAEQVLAEAPVPTMLVRATEHEPPPLAEHPTLLVPLDGSELAEEALPVARRLADGLDGNLLLVRAVRPPTHAYAEGAYTYSLRPAAHTTPYLAKLYEEARAEAEAYLNRVAGRMGSRSGRVRTDVLEGDPVSVITAAAREHDAAAIVMATRGRTGVSRSLLGSVANGVLRQGNLPVLLVRPGDTEGSSSPVAAQHEVAQARDHR